MEKKFQIFLLLKFFKSWTRLKNEVSSNTGQQILFWGDFLTILGIFLTVYKDGVGVCLKVSFFFKGLSWTLLKLVFLAIDIHDFDSLEFVFFTIIFEAFDDFGIFTTILRGGGGMIASARFKATILTFSLTFLLAPRNLKSPLVHPT